MGENNEPGALYREAVISSMVEALEEYNNGGEELPINMSCLEVRTQMKPNVVVFWDEDAQEYYEEEDGEEVLDYVEFLITTGGPHCEIRTDDNGRSYSFHYHTWGYSDKYYEELTGSDLETVQEVLNIWFEV